MANFSCGDSGGDDDDDFTPGDLRLSVNSLTFTHTDGTDACPQNIGSVTVTNTGAANLGWQFDANGYPVGADNPGGALGPGATATLNIQFTCVTLASFEGDALFLEASSIFHPLHITGTVN